MPILDILAPEITGNLEEYLLVSWNKKENDVIHEGELLATLRIQENTLEVQSPSDGVLINILVETEGRVAQGRVLGHLDVMDKKPARKTKIELERMDNTPSGQLPCLEKIEASEGAQRLADELDINLDDILAIGKRITEKDVINYLEERQKKNSGK